MPPQSRIEILARLLHVDIHKFKDEVADLINTLSDQEFDCLLSIRAKISDPKLQKYYDHYIVEGI